MNASFWSAERTAAFLLFSPSHLAAIVILVSLAVLLYFGRSAIRANRSRQTAVRGLLLVMLLVPEALLYGWYALERTWDVKSTLPLELCSITLMLSAIMLVTRSRLLYQLLFFAGIGGALQAMLTPSLGYPFPHFRFLHFFIVHGAIILSALYMTWVEGCKPTWRSVGFAMIFLNVLAGIVWIINQKLGSNYMFLMHKPATASILDALGPYPYYLLAEEAIAAALFALMYAVFFLKPFRKQDHMPPPSNLHG
ncbi:TIGR02206 family membrane protein [Paenibacillus sp. NPDC056579]|uniref:YwaF family protein n=1 Tax=unclassified Paenibacillus TaxID=185978 RepID=UPI001EF8A0B6|nr:TIGR02206 family membrane protein [Paenibacillus sp. H1-7]ULL14243.1 TIGR02206 family membrane protein [Paenibacillus sp. H1-7]